MAGAAAAGAPPALPIRAAFVYPWFPEAWSQSGVDPFTNYSPSAPRYASADPETVSRQVAAMQYGHINVGIASWWGVGTSTDRHLREVMDQTPAGFYWAVYYEPEGQGDPTVETIRHDIEYLRDRFASDPRYLSIDDRFVVFVWSTGDDCQMARRWRDATEGLDVYVVLKVFANYRSCDAQPDGWHQYGPATPASAQLPYSFTISPGFWRVGEEPRLERDLSRWRTDVQRMVDSDADWQLITTFNEWGEGTAVESADEWSSASGYGAYLDVLHEIAPRPRASGAAASTAPSAQATSTRSSGSPNGRQTPTSSPSPTTAATSTATPGATRPPSPPPPRGAATIVALGDIGANDRSDEVVRAAATAGASVVLALWDLSYSEEEPEQGWCDWMTERLGNTPIELVSGNHEEDNGPDGDILKFASCLPDRANSTGSYPAQYWFDVGPARVIMISPDLRVGGVEHQFGVGSSAYQWLEARLDEARTQGRWTIVGMHKNCITVGEKRCEIGEDVANLLAAKADLILQGHDHTYQRSHQLTCMYAGRFEASCVADDDSDHRQGEGAVLVIAGAVGRSLYDVSASDAEAPYFARWIGDGVPDAGQGYLRVDASADRLDVRWIGVRTPLSDGFVIRR